MWKVLGSCDPCPWLGKIDPVNELARGADVVVVACPPAPAVEANRLVEVLPGGLLSNIEAIAGFTARDER